MSTCRAAAARLESLSERVARATSCSPPASTSHVSSKTPLCSSR
ncbi:MAG: hypothetical protein WCA12_03635 [Burkholderiales bacterium]